MVLKIYFLITHVYVCICVCAYKCKYKSAATEEGYGSPGAGATGGCGLLNMSAENQTLVLCGSSSQSQLLNHLSTWIFLSYSEEQRYIN